MLFASNIIKCLVYHVSDLYILKCYNMNHICDVDEKKQDSIQGFEVIAVHLDAL